MLTTVVKRLFERISGFQVENFGSSFALINPDRREDAWFSHESVLRTLFAERQVNQVIDAGANTGQFALAVRKFFAGQIHSFEPVSATYEILAARAAADPAWHVHRLALGARAAEQEINTSQASDFNSFLSNNSYSVDRFGERSRQIHREMVSIRRLDAVLAESPAQPAQRRIFLKMDTQGYDLEVFKGLGQLLEHVVAIQSEVSLIPTYEQAPHWTESLAVFEQAGFGVVGFFPISVDAGRVIEYDCVMARRS